MLADSDAPHLQCMWHELAWLGSYTMAAMLQAQVVEGAHLRFSASAGLHDKGLAAFCPQPLLHLCCPVVSQGGGSDHDHPLGYRLALHGKE